MSQTDLSFLFIGGNPRSGTSALTNLINAHPGAAIGMERYIRVWHDERLTPADFMPDTFLATYPFDKGRNLAQNFANGGFADNYADTWLRGDKLPYIGTHLDYVFRTFKPCKVLFILRNPLSVCESFQARFDDPEDKFDLDAAAALTRWNRSLAQLAASMDRGQDILLVSYERTFQSMAAVETIYDALGLSIEEADRARLERKLRQASDLNIATTTRNERMRWKVAREANFDLYRQMIDTRCILRHLDD